MLPLIVGVAEAKRHILLYSLVLVAVSLLLAPANAMGLLYLGAATALGATFVGLAARLHRDRTVQAARGLFAFSTSYLALLFASMVADKMIF